ncbi:hypothetical protein EXN66_Car007441 [Channa argus]|uniref:C2H2-type domain-containing protein n=1 Tax=Channa argus TaxID=215402 RepID=A0A6G1PP42_CHAAH|nr:hypothetical protein EXN66_Car007441 [Channa argus]
MPSVRMERATQPLPKALDDDSGKELIYAAQFCFSCEQIFADRQSLEEHVCSAASYICSCGTEFAEYKDMQKHSTTHEPGHQVLDHETIRKRRIEKCIEEERQLKRLQTGEVVWKIHKLNSVPSDSLPVKPKLQAPITLSHMPKVPVQSARISKVPELYPSLSQASSLPHPVISGTDMKNIFEDVGAPTVDLWTLYHPVVLLQTMHKFNKKKPYSCGKCGQCFLTKTSLISHYSFHVTDKISGCIGCGLLLSSKKVVPRFHVCNSPSNATKFRFITASPLSYTRQNEASTVRSQDQGALGPQPTTSLQLKSHISIAASNGSQTPSITSTLPLKYEKIRTYSKNKGRSHGPSFLPSKTQNSSASKLHVNANVLSQNLAASVNSRQALSVTPSGHSMSSTNSLLSNPTQISSAKNGYTCRVCRFPFETTQLLQRHKCSKAQEFMAQNVRGGRNCKIKRVTPVASSIPAHMNGERKLGVTAFGNVKKKQLLAVTLNKEHRVDMDDDCYIVESRPDKPAEMIYQVTSSVPIKT